MASSPLSAKTSSVRLPRDEGSAVWGCVILSSLIHGGGLFLLLWHWNSPPLPEPKPEQPVEMVYEATPSSSVSARASQKAQVPAPPSPTEVKAPPTPEPPKPAPPEPTPPVPAPPPEAQASPEPTPKQALTPVQQKAPPSEKGEVSEKPKPVHKMQAKPAQIKAAEHQVEKPPAKPQSSQTHQTHEAPKHQADSHSLLATLESFRTEQKQDHPPRAQANPQQGGSRLGGGRPDGDTRALTSGEQNAIGSSVQRCYQEDTAARNYAHFEAHLIVTVDGAGEAHLVSFAPETATRMAADPSYRVQAERARAAVLSPVCARLPIPSRMLGQRRQFRFVFKP
ncbi:energy transducer TonB [Saccharibacter sp. EH611]|nr:MULTISPECIES: energy transducer TonB [unclassified Saccharibacter]MXV35207.1 energy transducer TonB [Saccharibacter sp. EH611]MXV57246.1 energy transducer TonB [Saccharibacter sp. EH70]MXV64893.1 energy transducer TonB [Saccharibacter sp. EH60]